MPGNTTAVISTLVVRTLLGMPATFGAARAAMEFAWVGDTARARALLKRRDADRELQPRVERARGLLARVGRTTGD